MDYETSPERYFTMIFKIIVPLMVGWALIGHGSSVFLTLLFVMWALLAWATTTKTQKGGSHTLPVIFTVLMVLSLNSHVMTQRSAFTTIATIVYVVLSFRARKFTTEGTTASNRPVVVPKGRTIGKGTVYGVAGSGIAAAKQFGDMASIGAQGEKTVGAMLEEVAAQHGGYVFHSLDFNPMHPTGADVDHVFMTRDGTVYLIDAKFWKYGDYRWVNEETIYRDGAPFVGGNVHMANALAFWQRYLGDRRTKCVIAMALPKTERYTVSGTAPRGLSLMPYESLRGVLATAARDARDGVDVDAKIARIFRAMKRA